jgi:hypothetical protein
MPRPTASARKAVKLSKPILCHLPNYALAAGTAGVSALALAQPAEAQIVYTPAHEIIGRGGKILIDLNHDGITDVTIREIPSSDLGPPGNSLQAVPRRVGGGIRMQSVIGFAEQMSPGSKIGPHGPFITGSAVMANWTNFGTYYFGFWVQAKNGYLGIRFPINGEIHYGWTRMSTMYSPKGKDIVALLTGYAYETQPNTYIRAGDEGPDSDQAIPIAFPLEQDGGKQSSLGALALGAPGISLRRGVALWEKPQE